MLLLERLLLRNSSPGQLNLLPAGLVQAAGTVQIIGGAAPSGPVVGQDLQPGDNVLFLHYAVNKENVILNFSGALPSTSEAAARFDVLGTGNILLYGEGLSVGAGSTIRSGYMPIGFVQHETNRESVPLGIVEDFCNFTALSHDEPDIEPLSSEEAEMHAGRLVIECRRNLTININECKVKIRPGSIVALTRDGCDFSVTNLHDEQAGAVELSSGSKRMPIHTGQQAVVCRRQLDDSDLAMQPIARRRQQSIEIDDGVVLLGDVSVVSLAQQDSVIREALRSSRSAKILKTQACLSLTTARYGAYNKEYSLVPSGVEC